MALAYSSRRKPLNTRSPVEDYIQRIHQMYINQYLRSDSRPAKVLCL